MSIEGKKISELTAADNFLAAYELAVRSGSTNLSVTGAQILAYITGEIGVDQLQIVDTYGDLDTLEKGDKAYLVIVVDASGDPVVVSGGALYAWKPDAGVSGEYRLLAKYETLDLEQIFERIGTPSKTRMKTAEPLDMQTQKIENVDAGTTATDGVNFGQVSVKIDKATNVESINDTDIADGEIAVFNLTNKDIRSSDKTIVTSLGADDTTVPTSKAVKDVTDTKATAPATHPANYVPNWGAEDSKELEAGREVEEVEYSDQTFADIDTVAEAGGTSTSLDVNELTDSSKTWEVDEHAGKFAVIEYINEAQYTPIRIEALKVSGNSANTLTFNKNREYTGLTSAATYEFLTPIELLGENQYMLATYKETGNTVIELATIESINNRNFVKVYSEYQTETVNNNRVWIYAKGANTIFGVDHLKLYKQRESLYLMQHAVTANEHWDVFLDEINISAVAKLVTPAAAFAANDTYVPVPAAAWDYGSPCRWEFEEADNDGVFTWVLRYKYNLDNLVSQQLILTIGEVAAAQSKNFFAQIEKWDVSAWVKVSNEANGATTNAIDVTQLVCAMPDNASEDDVYRAVVKCEDDTTFQVLEAIMKATKA